MPHIDTQKETQRLAADIQSNIFDMFIEMLEDIRNDSDWTGYKVNRTTLIEAMIVRWYKGHQKNPLKPKDL